MPLQEYRRLTTDQVIDLVSSQLLYKMGMGKKPNDTLSNHTYRVRGDYVLDKDSNIIGRIVN